MAKVEESFKEELARALKDGFTDAEVAAAKSGLLQKRVQTRAQDGAVASGWVYYLHHGRTFEFSKQLEERVRNLTPAEIVGALRKHIDPAKISWVKAGDFAKAK
jgi:zinc protease